MREIKFRAWVARDAMVYLPELTYESDKFAKAYADSDQERGGAILMQWTGLRDKNGKEIYEGDILQFSWDDEAKISEESMRFPVIVHSLGNLEPYGAVTGQVIGNIYENPELLTV